MYEVVLQHTRFIDTFAVQDTYICSWTATSMCGTMRGDIPPCISYGSDSAYYFKRVLTLSADVETNPGPDPSSDENTQLIYQAIAETKNKKKCVREQVNFVQKELGSLREEIVAKKSKVDSLEHRQEILNSDVAALSLDDDRKEERLANMEIQFNSMELEGLKPSLRIFCLDENESDIKPLEYVIYSLECV
ncbi:hypothetical protein DPMN_147382 [Dreissena polymorpha]|uniref:Uncharacterized protein n=1 Tax=Dreissena polymorpha TaxID=45954 RepID=A0A9D4FC38_DREPO|nr:hypothetical protein DPMN_147382 [Dreissena polymorpha]